jgi:hypothetical protein
MDLQHFKELWNLFIFGKHLDIFMKISLDDLTVYNDMEIHLQKLRLCFQKCKEYNINLNFEKCVSMVFSRVIIGFIISKGVKIL